MQTVFDKKFRYISNRHQYDTCIVTYVLIVFLPCNSVKVLSTFQHLSTTVKLRFKIVGSERVRVVASLPTNPSRDVTHKQQFEQALSEVLIAQW